MAKGDKTGPEGLGSMTGRQMGYCAGNDRPGFENSTRRFGRGRGFGGGMGNRFGNRRGYSENVIPNVSEKTLLENEIKILKEQLNSIEKQLETKETNL